VQWGFGSIVAAEVEPELIQVYSLFILSIPFPLELLLHPSAARPVFLFVTAPDTEYTSDVSRIHCNVVFTRAVDAIYSAGLCQSLEVGTRVRDT
jgi:hypothetical protein